MLLISQREFSMLNIGVKNSNVKNALDQTDYRSQNDTTLETLLWLWTFPHENCDFAQGFLLFLWILPFVYEDNDFSSILLHIT